MSMEFNATGDSATQVKATTDAPGTMHLGGLSSNMTNSPEDLARISAEINTKPAHESAVKGFGEISFPTSSGHSHGFYGLLKKATDFKQQNMIDNKLIISRDRDHKNPLALGKKGLTAYGDGQKINVGRVQSAVSGQETIGVSIEKDVNKSLHTTSVISNKGASFLAAFKF